MEKLTKLGITPVEAEPAFDEVAELARLKRIIEERRISSGYYELQKKYENSPPPIPMTPEEIENEPVEDLLARLG